MIKKLNIVKVYNRDEQGQGEGYICNKNKKNNTPRNIPRFRFVKVFCQSRT